ncbi:MAG: 50S ribosomal protein L23 [Spirochaetes bacterium GWF1_31_7]|nr:MAG: 50S ribosomal protein L23 [Spirochaetes bacterium GWE1_32_154]OHD47318.1 MAG: 50S ribosomal protein L23 [Spirochaetes bacterium GWE2_31_10]OHD47378.1 MAG: 50S ribosomal protein L23 [Spirochaetes bacterium GWF1_31_7]OHD77897.1 MAG: 50S ribosomal protein L23 [Spirochaetes bacterium RIFOXYB1_FULL_32_8]HBD92833.1 50S ribosomal protein L23 [Spirochaetia bacterium]
MRSEEIILRPVLSEKSTALREKSNKIVFVVSKEANKIMIKNAVKELFDVDPVSVNVINNKGKMKRVRYKYGKTASFKKAIVTLKQGDKISIFEGA